MIEVVSWIVGGIFLFGILAAAAGGGDDPDDPVSGGGEAGEYD